MSNVSQELLSEKIYCTYLHFKKNRQDGMDEPFYCGMGNIKRPFEKKSRNRFWHNVVKKYDYYVVIIDSNVDWKTASQFEKQYIRKFGLRSEGGSLVNLTYGGEGALGYKHTKESKDKMSKIHKGKTPWNKDKTDIYTEETLERITEKAREITTKRYENPEERKKTSEDMLKAWENMSEETKQKRAEKIREKTKEIDRTKDADKYSKTTKSFFDNMTSEQRKQWRENKKKKEDYVKSLPIEEREAYKIERRRKNQKARHERKKREIEQERLSMIF